MEKIINYFIAFLISIWIICFIADYHSGKKVFNGNAIVISKEFVEKKTGLNPALITQTIPEHYIYVLKITDVNTKDIPYVLKSYKNNLNVDDKIKVNYKVGKYSNIFYAFEIQN